MIYIATNKDNKDALMHYGVKGMRWGKRGGGINRYRRLAPGTPGLSAPTKVLNTYGIHRGNAVTKARPDKEHNTYGIHKGAAVTGSTVDRPRDYNPKPPIPQRNTAKKTLERGTSGNSNRWRSQFDRDTAGARTRGNGFMSPKEYMRRHGNGLSYSDTHGSEGFENRPSSSSKQMSSSRVRDLRRRRYGR